MKAIKFRSKPNVISVELPLEVRDITLISELPLSNSSEYWVIMTGKELNDYFSQVRLRNEPVKGEDIFLDQQKNQREFGIELAANLVDLMGKRNLKMTFEGRVLNVSSLLQTLGSVKALMETGALKTARSVMSQVKPMYPLYTDILDYANDKISKYLTKMKYD